MNIINLMGIGISEFGMTFGAIASYSHAKVSSIYFGWILWVIGLLLLFYEENKWVKK